MKWDFVLCKLEFGRELYLAAWQSVFMTTKLKIYQYLLLAYMYICMAIPYRTAKSKSANVHAKVIWDPNVKFNSQQFFRLYGSVFCIHKIMHVIK